MGLTLGYIDPVAFNIDLSMFVGMASLLLVASY